MNVPTVVRFWPLNLVLAVLSAGALTAQPASEQMQRFALDLARKDANAEGAVASGEPEISLEATEEGGVVAAILGFKFNNDLTSFTTKVSGPLDKEAEEAELVNLQDLPGGVEASFRLSHAWFVSWLPSASLTTACLDINRILSTRFPDPPDDVIAPLKSLDLKTGKARFDAYKSFWPDFRLYMIDRSPKPPDEIPPPQWAAIEGRAVEKLCTEWNSGRVNDLLLGEVFQNQAPGAAPHVQNPVTDRRSDDCNLENLLARRVGKARAAATANLPDLDKVKAKALEARDEERALAAMDLANAIQEAKDLEARGVSEDAIEVLLASARLKHQHTQRESQRAHDETIAAAEKTIENAAAQAAETETKAVYEALAASVAKEIDKWTGLTVPFFRKPFETIGDFQCNDIDAEALLASLSKDPERNAVFRRLRAAAPSQFFLTGDYSTAAQSFKYFAAPLALNPATQSIATKTDKEYNHAGRLGASVSWHGHLLSLGWEQKSKWEPKPASQICFPRGADGSLVCVTTATGAPERVDERVFDLQWKLLITPALAMQAQVFYADDTDSLNPHLITFFCRRPASCEGGADFSYIRNNPDGMMDSSFASSSVRHFLSASRGGQQA